MSKEKNDLKLNINYSCMQGCYWFITAAAMVYVVALLRHKGYNDSQIGSILSIKYLAAVVSQFVLSSLVDKLIKKISLKFVIYMLCIVNIITSVVFYLVDMPFIGAAVCFALFGCTINGVYPYINATATKFMNRGRKVYYSIARGVGSIMWGLGSIILSSCVDAFGVTSVLIVQIIITALLMLSTLIIEKIPEPNKKEGAEEEVHSYLYLFKKYPAYTLFLVSSVFMFVANNLMTTFMVDIVSRVGGGNRELGYVELAIALYELPPALLFIALRKKLGVRKILCVSVASLFLQVLLTIFSKNVVMLIFSQALQIFGVGMYWNASVYFVSQEIPEQDVVKGQALVNICSLGLGGVIGSLVSGNIMNRFGIEFLLKCSAGLVAVGILTMVIGMNINKKKKTGGM